MSGHKAGARVPSRKAATDVGAKSRKPVWRPLCEDRARFRQPGLIRIDAAHENIRLVPLLELFFALPALIWGGAVVAWLNTKGVVIKLWTAVWATLLSTVIPAVIYAAADEGTRHIIRGVLN